MHIKENEHFLCRSYDYFDVKKKIKYCDYEMSFGKQLWIPTELALMECCLIYPKPYTAYMKQFSHEMASLVMCSRMLKGV